MYTSSKYLIRRKVLKVFGADFRVYDSHEMENEILFSHLKAFKLKEDIRLFSDDSKTDELITIKARKIIDFSSAYDVVDTKTGKKLGALKRKGMKSIFRDEWLIMDENDNEIGKIKEDSGGLAFLRRFITALIPQRFDIFIGDTKVAEFKNNFNPFVSKVEITFLVKDNERFSRQFGVATGVLICAIEGKQG